MASNNYLSKIAPYALMIEKHATPLDIPADVMGNIIFKESSGNPRCFRQEATDASYGLSQILYKNAVKLGFTGRPEELFDPELSIMYGIKWLKTYRDALWPLFSKDTSELDKWKVITSSYNQGILYYRETLAVLNSKHVSTSWINVLNYITQADSNTFSNHKMPWKAMAKHYGPAVTGTPAPGTALVEGRWVNTDKTIQLAMTNLRTTAVIAMIMVGVILSVMSYRYLKGNREINITLTEKEVSNGKV
jgi:hypothetical protein